MQNFSTTNSSFDKIPDNVQNAIDKTIERLRDGNQKENLRERIANLSLDSLSQDQLLKITSIKIFSNKQKFLQSELDLTSPHIIAVKDTKLPHVYVFIGEEDLDTLSKPKNKKADQDIVNLKNDAISFLNRYVRAVLKEDKYIPQKLNLKRFNNWEKSLKRPEAQYPSLAESIESHIKVIRDYLKSKK